MPAMIIQPPERARRRIARNKEKASDLRTLGHAIMVVSLLCLFAGAPGVAVTVGSIAGSLYFRAHRYNAQTADGIRGTDARPPILLLRAFSAEDARGSE